MNPTGQPEPVAATGFAAAAQRVAQRVIDGRGAGHFYTRELALAGLLAFPAGSAVRSAGSALARQLRPAAAGWAAEPFGSLTWALWEATGDPQLRDGFVAETAVMLREAPCATDGVYVHPRGAARGGGHAVLLDSGVEQICRLARAAGVSGEARFITACRFQLAAHRALLRDPATGLWCQGRGWCTDPTALSPGAWSRGQGWLLRALVAAARSTSGTLRDELQATLVETVAALLARQDAAGWCHTMMQRPHTASAVETSGTAMIAAALAEAVRHGLIAPQPAGAAVQRALAALTTVIDATGVVHGTCHGPGPLSAEAPWLVPAFAADDAHGAQAVLPLIAAAGCAAPAVAPAH